MLADILKRIGETYVHDNYDFDIEDADFFADFFNNGGLEFHGNFVNINYAFVYAALYPDGNVRIGAWVWLDDEDFDQDAIFCVYDEDELPGIVLKMIYDKIEEIYGKE